MKDLKQTILNRVDEVFDQYNQLLPDNQIDSDSITVRFTLRGLTAGSSHWAKRTLNFNLILATNNLSEFLARTVPHEIAHLYQTKIYPLSDPHGKEWKRIMRLGGYAPVRCHSYDTSGLTTYKHTYVCNCPNRTHMLSTVRHNKVVRGVANYTCTICGYSAAPKGAQLLGVEYPGCVAPQPKYLSLRYGLDPTQDHTRDNGKLDQKAA